MARVASSAYRADETEARSGYRQSNETCLQAVRSESRVQRVAGSVSDQAAQHRLADQCKIAKQIERLMTNKLVRETEATYRSACRSP